MNKNELMKKEIKRLVELVNCSTGVDKEDYKRMVHSLMNEILQKDWNLFDECQLIIDQNYKGE